MQRAADESMAQDDGVSYSNPTQALRAVMDRSQAGLANTFGVIHAQLSKLEIALKMELRQQQKSRECLSQYELQYHEAMIIRSMEHFEASANCLANLDVTLQRATMFVTDLAKIGQVFLFCLVFFSNASLQPKQHEVVLHMPSDRPIPQQVLRIKPLSKFYLFFRISPSGPIPAAGESRWSATSLPPTAHASCSTSPTGRPPNGCTRCSKFSGRCRKSTWTTRDASAPWSLRVPMRLNMRQQE